MTGRREPGRIGIFCALAVLFLCICAVTAVTCDGPPKNQLLTLQAGGCNQSPAVIPCTETFLFPAAPSAAGDSAAQYYLDYGDGSVPYYGFNDFTSHTYDYPGTYPIRYGAGTVCDYWITSADHLLVVEPLNYTPVLHGCPPAQPQAGFTGLPLTGIAPLTVQFTSTSAGANAYAWDFGDGTTSPAENPRHTYMSPGLYTVTLDARDICTGTTSTATMSHYVTVTVQSGTLLVSTEPQNANVFVDNVFKGVTPLTLTDTASGYHKVRIALPGYEDYVTEITVEPSQTMLVKTDLRVSANGTPTLPAPVTATPPAGPPPQQNGTIAVTSIPNGASVTLDDAYEGTTPVIIPEVIPGNYNISLTYPGYAAYNQSVSVGSSQTTAVNANLVVSTEPAPGTSGTLLVVTDPPGARVSVDGDIRGVSPASIPGLSAGKHTVNLRLEDYYDLTATVNVTSGQTQNYTAALRKTFKPSIVELGLAGTVVLIVILAGVYRLLRKDEI